MHVPLLTVLRTRVVGWRRTE